MSVSDGTEQPLRQGTTPYQQAQRHYITLLWLCSHQPPLILQIFLAFDMHFSTCCFRSLPLKMTSSAHIKSDLNISSIKITDYDDQSQKHLLGKGMDIHEADNEVSTLSPFLMVLTCSLLMAFLAASPRRLCGGSSFKQASQATRDS